MYGKNLDVEATQSLADHASDYLHFPIHRPCISFVHIPSFIEEIEDNCYGSNSRPTTCRSFSYIGTGWCCCRSNLCDNANISISK